MGYLKDVVSIIGIPMLIAGVSIVMLFTAGLSISRLTEQLDNSERIMFRLTRILSHALKERDLVTLQSTLGAGLDDDIVEIRFVSGPNFNIWPEVLSVGNSGGRMFTLLEWERKVILDDGGYPIGELQISASLLHSLFSVLKNFFVPLMFVVFITIVIVTYQNGKIASSIVRLSYAVMQIKVDRRIDYSGIEDHLVNTLPRRISLPLIEALNKLGEIYFLRHQASLSISAQKTAHDIRSPLTALRMLIKCSSELPAPKMKLLVNASQRIEDICENLLKESRGVYAIPGQSDTLVKVDNLLSNIIEEKKIEIGGTAFPSIEWVVNFGSINFIKMDPIGFSRVISNLINNAVKSMESRFGRLTIKTYDLPDRAVVEIQDTGTGMPMDVIKKVRHLPFSTKENGNGIGLYSAIKEINRIGGDLKIESGLSGTTVRIFLPTYPIKATDTLISDTGTNS